MEQFELFYPMGDLFCHCESSISKNVTCIECSSYLLCWSNYICTEKYFNHAQLHEIHVNCISFIKYDILQMT